MKHKTTLLFLYTVPGTGHQKAADAIMRAVSQIDPKIRCIGRDVARHAAPFIGSLFNKIYLQILTRAPAIWDTLYDNPDVEFFTRGIRSLLTFVSSFRMRQFLKTYHPTAVICTQAVPMIAMAAEKKKKRLGVPLIGVITDFSVHRYWLHPEVDHTIVAHPDIKKQMIRHGISPEKISATGIPVDPAFGESGDKENIRKRLNLDPKQKTFLLMGGSHGIGSLEEMVKTLQRLPGIFQAIVVCGRNKQLAKRIALAAKKDSRIHVMGYVKSTADLMRAADVVITKPGGLSCSEALAAGRPLFLTHPLPGQEKRNLRFLTKHQAAVVIRTSKDFLPVVQHVSASSNAGSLMREKATALAKPLSALHAAQRILKLIHPSPTDNKAVLEEAGNLVRFSR